MSLLTLVGTIMKGSSTNIDLSDGQACLLITQLIVFNSISRPCDRPEAAGSTHHVRFRECPLPIYIALKIHRATQDRSLIDTFYNLGLCILCDRFLTVSTEITNSVSKDINGKEFCALLNKLNNGLFAMAAVDNIDHNTSAQSSFHGTAISLVQNHPATNDGKTKKNRYI